MIRVVTRAFTVIKSRLLTTVVVSALQKVPQPGETVDGVGGQSLPPEHLAAVEPMGGHLKPVRVRKSRAKIPVSSACL